METAVGEAVEKKTEIREIYEDGAKIAQNCAKGLGVLCMISDMVIEDADEQAKIAFKEMKAHLAKTIVYLDGMKTSFEHAVSVYGAKK